jgi:hypothetical protein
MQAGVQGFGLPERLFVDPAAPGAFRWRALGLESRQT